MENYQLRETIAGVIKELSQPIPAQLLKTKKQGGSDLTYIPWYNAVRVLDRVAVWSYEIRKLEQIGENLVCVARITIGDVYREATGIEALATKSYGDAASNAESMALRRAAAKFGLGLYLYDKEQHHEAPQPSQPRQSAPVNREGPRTQAAKAEAQLEAKPCRECGALGGWKKAKGKPVFIDLKTIDTSTLAADEFWIDIKGDEGFWKKGPAQGLGFLRHACRSVAKPAPKQAARDDDNEPPPHDDDDIPF